MGRSLFPDGNDERHVAVPKNLDHAVLVEGDAAAGVGLRALHVDEDGTALGVDTRLVEVGGRAFTLLYEAENSTER